MAKLETIFKNVIGKMGAESEITKSEISNLVRTPEWQRLCKIPGEVEKFNLFTLLNDAVCENTWSRFLTYLFTSNESHALGTRPFVTWLEALPSDCAKQITETLPNHFKTNAKFNWRTDEVPPRFLDILVEIRDLDQKMVAVVGIENKVWSGEGRDQLRAYQKAIANKYPSSNCPKKILVFLTPEGISSETCDEHNTDCRCISSSYRTLLTMCKEIEFFAQSELKILLTSLHDFLQLEILGEKIVNKEAKELIRALYQDEKNRRALNYIRHYHPGLEMAENLKREIEERFRKKAPNENPWWKFEPKLCEAKGETPQQIKMEFEKRTDAPFLIVYMLTAEKRNPDIGDKYTMCIGAWADKPEGQKAIQKLAKRLKFPESTPDYKKWGWGFFQEFGTYDLTDLGEKDVKGLTFIFNEALTKTYDLISAQL